MNFEGTLTLWNAERGYGEITPLAGGQAVFVHVSALPMDGEPMRLGELLSFEIVSGRDGCKAAARVHRLQRVAASAAERVLMAAAPRRPPSLRQRRRRRLTAWFSAALLAGLVCAGYVGFYGGWYGRWYDGWNAGLHVGEYGMRTPALQKPTPAKRLESRACLGAAAEPCRHSQAQPPRFSPD